MRAAYEANEKDLQDAVVQYLRIALRKIVLETNAGVHGRMAKLARENDVRVGLKATKGVPDLLVTDPTWPTGCMLGMELKTARGKLSPEQAELEKHGCIVVCRSIEDAEKAVKWFERSIIAHPGPMCRVCGCSELNACQGGCAWIAPDLCDRCAGKEEAVKRDMDPAKMLRLGFPRRFHGVKQRG